MTTATEKDYDSKETGLGRDWLCIGLNVFTAAIKRYRESEQELLEWLWGYTFNQLKGSKSELCRSMNLDFELIQNVFIGKYDGDMEAFCDIIRTLKKKAEKQIPLVHNVVTRRIMEVLDYARDYCAMVFITGTTGRGKTMTLQTWAINNNHGRSRYVRIPSGCTRRVLVTSLCHSCGIGATNKKTSDMEERLRKAFTPRNVIIIDEAGHLLPKNGSGSTAAIEFLRDLYDSCGCGLALVFTDVYLDEMRHGKLSAYFEQFIGRQEFEVRIPEKVRRDEVISAVKAFNPTPSKKMIEMAVELARNRDGKLRTLYRDLDRAANWAVSQGRKFPDHEDLKAASTWRMSGGVWPED